MINHLFLARNDHKMVILRDESKIHERLAPLFRKSLIFTILVVRQAMNRRFIKIEENIEDILTRIEDSCLKRATFR